jgi:hypothetical protein
MKAGRKKNKQCVAVFLVCYASGSEKRGMFIIGKCKRPCRFLRYFQPKRDAGTRDANNKTAWMTSQEYCQWLPHWNAWCSQCGYLLLFFCACCYAFCTLTGLILVV